VHHAGDVAADGKDRVDKLGNGDKALRLFSMTPVEPHDGHAIGRASR
jgi:hypothetical protein